jgi:hypothetical protein
VVAVEGQRWMWESRIWGGILFGGGDGDGEMRWVRDSWEMDLGFELGIGDWDLGISVELWAVSWWMGW